MCYATGSGVPQDKQKATALFKQAAREGNVSAMCNLADCYFDGDGIDQDKQKAIEWYQRAAASGCSEAKHKLESMDLKTDEVSEHEKTMILSKKRVSSDEEN